MFVTVVNWVFDNGEVKKKVHELNHFPSYNDMLVFCKRDGIKAVDFVHDSKSDDGTFYVGRFLAVGNKPAPTNKGKRGLKFFVRCSEKPTYEDLVR